MPVTRYIIKPFVLHLLQIPFVPDSSLCRACPHARPSAAGARRLHRLFTAFAPILHSLCLAQSFFVYLTVRCCPSFEPVIALRICRCGRGVVECSKQLLRFSREEVAGRQRRDHALECALSEAHSCGKSWLHAAINSHRRGETAQRLHDHVPPILVQTRPILPHETKATSHILDRTLHRERPRAT